MCPNTIKNRERHYNFLLEFLRKDKGDDVDLGVLLDSETGRDELTDLIGRFFFTKRKYAEKIRNLFTLKCLARNLSHGLTSPNLLSRKLSCFKLFAWSFSHGLSSPTFRKLSTLLARKPLSK